MHVGFKDNVRKTQVPKLDQVEHQKEKMSIIY